MNSQEYMRNKSFNLAEELSKWSSTVTPLIHDDIFISPRANGCAWRVGCYFAFNVSLPDPMKIPLSEYPQAQSATYDSAAYVDLKFRMFLN